MKALLTIDLQMEMQHRIDKGRDCVNPDAAAPVTALIDAFRQQAWPVIHIRHRDDTPGSPLHADATGYPPMACAAEKEGDAVFVKRTSSAFASTDLAAYLREKGVTDLVVTGAVAEFCVNSTVRQGADLGFAMTVARDAVIGFDLPDAGLSAQAIFDVTMALLQADFARVVDTSDLLP